MPKKKEIDFGKLIKIKNSYIKNIYKHLKEQNFVGANFIITEDIEKLFQEILKEII